MGLRSLATSVCLALAGAGAVGQSGGIREPQAIPAGASRLLARIAGVPDPGPLLFSSSSTRTGEDGAVGRIHRLAGMDSGLWVLVSAQGEAMDGAGGYQAAEIEAWLGSDPVLSVADFRLAAAGPDRIALASGKLHFRASHRELRVAVSADRSEAGYDGAVGGMVQLTGVEGTLSAPGPSSGRRMQWTAAQLEAEGGRFRLSELAAWLGPDKRLEADLLEFGSGPGGSWMIRIDGLAASPGLTGRFRPLAGLGLPPVAVSAFFEPPNGGRWLYTAQIDAGAATFRLDGWVAAGSGSVAVDEARGLLGFLAAAGSADPLAAATRMGLFYGDAEQGADLIQGVNPGLRQVGN